MQARHILLIGLLAASAGCATVPYERKAYKDEEAAQVQGSTAVYRPHFYAWSPWRNPFYWSVFDRDCRDNSVFYSSIFAPRCKQSPQIHQSQPIRNLSRPTLRPNPVMDRLPYFPKIP